MGRLAKVLGGQCQPGLKAFKKGGKTANSDAAEDVKLIKASVKPEALKKKGGAVKRKK